jgi:biotin operon repressor
MPSLSPDVNVWLASHHCVISATKLRELGMSAHAIRTLRERGVLIHLGRRVYRLAGAPLTEQSRMVSLCLMFDGSFITGPSAGRLRGLRGMGRDLRIHLAVPHGRHVRVQPGVVLHQTSHHVVGVDVEERPDGIRVATGARLAADLAEMMTPSRLADVVEDLLNKRATTEKALVDISRRRARAARKRRGSLAKVLLARVPGGPLESGHEVILAQALRDAGLPIVAQVRLLQIPDGGPPIRVDLSVPDLRWGIEVDIHPEHAIDAGALDKRRDRRGQLIDWQTSRYTELDFLDLAATVDEIVALYHARIEALAARSGRT